MSDVLYIFDKFRISRLNCHVCDINKPPVTKFNLTLFNLFLGAMMMPSRVLSYLQMGHFLMLVMALGWAFSTLYILLPGSLQHYWPARGLGTVQLE